MNKTQLVEQLAKEAQLTRADTERCLNALVETVKRTLKKGQEVKITGFGRWYVSKRKARTGRNPQTGAEIKIPAAKVPAFRSGKTLRRSVK